MVIAGGQRRRSPTFAFPQGFNGAGDGDRRRVGRDRRICRSSAGFNGAGDGDRRRGPGWPRRRRRRSVASTEPAMVIAGGRRGRLRRSRRDDASTEPAMVIAGGRCPRARSRPRRSRFNGAGDGDRRRAPRRARHRVGARGASTEPAMVIAGGRAARWQRDGVRHASTEPAMVIAGGTPF